MGTTCDLCHEYSTTTERCSECGHRIEARPAPPRQVVPSPLPPRGRQPFGEQMAPRRARHRSELRALAEWALAEGRRYDVDVAALCLDVLRTERPGDDDTIRLDRPSVTRLLGGSLRNRASVADTRLPEDWVCDVWTVLRFLSDTGRLDPVSDPEHALLEPLQCYGGLGTDGWPRAEGVDVSFPCQCYVAHDPTCPPGMAQHIIGRDWGDGTEFLVRAHVHLRSEDVPISAFAPLSKLARRLRTRNSFFIVALDQFVPVGTVPATTRAPELWIYRFQPESRRGFDPLILDEHGFAVRAKRNRSYRSGYRWEQIDDRQAVEVCGLASWTFARPEPGRWVPDDEPVGDVALRSVPDDEATR